MNRKLIAGNWKMNLLPGEVGTYADTFLMATAELEERVDLLLCPAFPALAAARAVFSPTPVALGAQNMHEDVGGAFTGEVSASMLRDLGVEAVLLGHSERRHIFGEPDELISKKLRRALDSGLKPILCLGELLEEREVGRTEEVLQRQLETALRGLEPAALDGLTLAYEPVWAIGTGRTATPETARLAHGFLRALLVELPGIVSATATAIRILYGGSVKAENAAELMIQPDIDGVLVGGASLDPLTFAAIAQAAPH